MPVTFSRCLAAVPFKNRPILNKPILLMKKSMIQIHPPPLASYDPLQRLLNYTETFCNRYIVADIK